MKYLSSVILTLFCIVCLTSCFKDEPLNAECDIETAWVHSDNPESMFFNLSDSLINVKSDVSEIMFDVKSGTDLTNLAPMFTVTGGATITPGSGSAHDFSDGKTVTYTVKSQDGAWSRKYVVGFRIIKRTKEDIVMFDFENFRLNEGGKYYEWFDINEDGTEAKNWATGNPGFMIAMGSATADNYPTTPVTDGGLDGAAVRMETKSTGAWGATAGKRIAAGNLFFGEFDFKYVLTETLKSTRFGLRFDKKPINFSGYYKYTPGEKFQDQYGQIINGRTDRAAIYSVLYRNHDEAGNPLVLHGDNVLSSEQIVAIARIPYVAPTTEWTKFDVDFNYIKELDEELLYNYGYNLAIVFSSSDEGDHFEGAVGSELMIDKVRVTCTITE
ncbi:MAG: PCMD domain-containing protein [Prevotella sp.]|nr:PCMD domain-containing protein [Prevotella sp.]